MFKQSLLKVIFVIGGVISIGLPAISKGILPTILDSPQHNNLDLKKSNIVCRILNRDCKGSPPRRSPEEGFCPIWPVDRGSEYLTSWSDRPTFVWVGKVKEIKIYPFAEEEAIWQKDNIEPDTKRFFYPEDEESLERGKLYHYVVSYETLDGEIKESKPIPFKIMEEDDAQSIENDNIETDSSLNELENAEQQSAHFSNLGLIADAIRVILSVDTDDADWNANIDSDLRDECENSGGYEE